MCVCVCVCVCVFTTAFDIGCRVHRELLTERVSSASQASQATGECFCSQQLFISHP